ncbi:MAG TPA: hypothetical protein V6C97_12305 [Oculatellaceae cyanobacterium]
MNKVRVLSIDGGGQIIPTLLLDKIETITDKKTHELFDFVVATGTGVLAAWVFQSDELAKDASDRCGTALKIYEEIFTAKEQLGANVDKKFGGKKLSIAKSPLVTICYDCETFDTVALRSDESRFEYDVSSIIKASLAGPQSLEPVEICEKYRTRYLISGAILNNNPILHALQEISHRQPEFGQADAIVVSLGSGLTTTNWAEAKEEEERTSFSLVSLAARASATWVEREAAEMVRLMDRTRPSSHDIYRLNIEVNLPLNDFWTDKERYVNAYLSAAQTLIEKQGKTLKRICDELTTRGDRR